MKLRIECVVAASDMNMGTGTSCSVEMETGETTWLPRESRNSVGTGKQGAVGWGGAGAV